MTPVVPETLASLHPGSKRELPTFPKLYFVKRLNFYFLHVVIAVPFHSNVVIKHHLYVSTSRASEMCGTKRRRSNIHHARSIATRKSPFQLRNLTKSPPPLVIMPFSTNQGEETNVTYGQVRWSVRLSITYPAHFEIRMLSWRREKRDTYYFRGRCFHAFRTLIHLFRQPTASQYRERDRESDTSGYVRIWGHK